MSKRPKNTRNDNIRSTGPQQKLMNDFFHAAPPAPRPTPEQHHEPWPLTQKPECRYGNDCYQRNQDHWDQFAHPLGAQRPSKHEFEEPRASGQAGPTDSRGGSGSMATAPAPVPHALRLKPMRNPFLVDEQQDVSGTDGGSAMAIDVAPDADEWEALAEQEDPRSSESTPLTKQEHTTHPPADHDGFGADTHTLPGGSMNADCDFDWPCQRVALPCVKGEYWASVCALLQDRISDIKQLLRALKQIYRLKSSSRSHRAPRFSGLAHVLNNLDDVAWTRFVNHTLPFMAELALSLPVLCADPIPLLLPQESLVLTQQQCACLLANCFFGTFGSEQRGRGRRSVQHPTFPSFDMYSLFNAQGAQGTASRSQTAKIHCLLNYFARLSEHLPLGQVRYSHQALDPTRVPQWASSVAPIASCALTVETTGTIEDTPNALHMDFANALIGGGVLGRGAVQEEIRFALCPELIVARLFTPRLEDRAALVVRGAERFSTCRGYAQDLDFDSNYVDTTPFDEQGCRDTTVIAIDAVHFGTVDGGFERQFEAQYVLRELNKAYVGFLGTNGFPNLGGASEAVQEQESSSSGTLTGTVTTTPPASAATTSAGGPARRPVATGRWGCGAFLGDIELKFIIQLMAAAVAQRPMVFYTFGDTGLCERLAAMHGRLCRANATVGQLWAALSNVVAMRQASHHADRPSVFAVLGGAMEHGNT